VNIYLFFVAIAVILFMHYYAVRTCDTHDMLGHESLEKNNLQQGLNHADTWLTWKIVSLITPFLLAAVAIYGHLYM
jgi:hypothetical protein